MTCLLSHGSRVTTAYALWSFVVATPFCISSSQFQQYLNLGRLQLWLSTGSWDYQCISGVLARIFFFCSFTWQNLLEIRSVCNLSLFCRIHLMPSQHYFLRGTSSINLNRNWILHRLSTCADCCNSQDLCTEIKMVPIVTLIRILGQKVHPIATTIMPGLLHSDLFI